MATIKTAKWLKATLTDQGMTQKKLAEKSRLSLPTIAKIISGERLGSVETWQKIQDVLGDSAPKISVESAEFICELKEEIYEYGGGHECYVFYEVRGGNILFHDYALPEDLNDPKFPVDGLEEQHKLRTTLKEALELFENQNNIF